MTNENNTAAEITKELAKDLYEDAGHEIVKPTGKLVGLIPRAIQAALQPLEMWTMQREYNIAATKKLLEIKLAKIDPAKISPPEPYVAVPALQAISYCMDNEELRNMYANLLAKSMTDVVRNGVHPCFVEMIKQLCPDEARILRHIAKCGVIPIIDLCAENEKHESIDLMHNFSDVGYACQCESPNRVDEYIDNLTRLGLLERPAYSSLVDKSQYEPLTQHEMVVGYKEIYTGRFADKPFIRVNEGFVRITSLGVAFCKTCISEDLR